MDLNLSFFRGSVIVSAPTPDASGVLVPDAGLRSLSKEFARHLRTLLVPATVTKPRGTRGFSFHWSNAQAAWDVVPWADPSWHTDGAEFLVYFTNDALSPVGKKWTLKEMEYVAKMLPPHPGYAHSFEGMTHRVARRFFEGRSR